MTLVSLDPSVLVSVREGVANWPKVDVLMAAEECTESAGWRVGGFEAVCIAAREEAAAV